MTIAPDNPKNQIYGLIGNTFLRLAQALDEISKMIHFPHFKTRHGKKFGFEAINEALASVAGDAKSQCCNYKL